VGGLFRFLNGSQIKPWHGRPRMCRARLVSVLFGRPGLFLLCQCRLATSVTRRRSRGDVPREMAHYASRRYASRKNTPPPRSRGRRFLDDKRWRDVARKQYAFKRGFSHAVTRCMRFECMPHIALTRCCARNFALQDSCCSVACSPHILRGQALGTGQ